MTAQNPIKIDPQILGGIPVFEGTRVPVKTLIDYLSAGESLQDFLDDFPSVGNDQVMKVLKLITDKIPTLAT